MGDGPVHLRQRWHYGKLNGMAWIKSGLTSHHGHGPGRNADSTASVLYGR